MKRFLLIFSTILLNPAFSGGQPVKSPDEFLGYGLGTKFTFHHKVTEYCKYVADQSTSARYETYGKTYEGRELGVLIISSPENLSALDEIRKNNLISAGLAEGTSTGKQLPFIWLSYNVHGNETAGTETAIKVIHTLVSRSYEGADDWLKECIIVIDPCQNPDGRDLYVHRFTSAGNMVPNPDGLSREHRDGWPGSRSNHYMFDLNRDWAWQTQAESSQRISFYNKYMPHVHADFHEMGAESTFFFPPGAKPWHEVITPWQLEFHTITGKENARLFDQQGKLYFTKETFDLFCPSFGDTWPLFNGAMGFTYEQGGGGMSGLSYKKESGDTLTLTKRIEGHFTASMATIKAAFENRARIISEFNLYFAGNSARPQFGYKSIIIKGNNPESDLHDMLELLEKNQIKYSLAGNIGKKYRGFDYLKNSTGEVKIEAGDILISAYQPQSRLMQVLFEPDSKASDSLSYDLSAWALPYAYNLSAFAIEEQVKPFEGKAINNAYTKSTLPEKPYGYIIGYSDFNVLKFISALHQKNVRIRQFLKPVRMDQDTCERGSFAITRSDNAVLGAKLDNIVREQAEKMKVRIRPLTSGLAASGKDVGSEYTPLLKKPAVAILGGKDASSSQTGELWYFFEQELGYPVSIIDADEFKRADQEKYDVLIIPSGSYPALSDTIIHFAKSGGRVIALERAIAIFSSEKSTSLFKSVETRTAEQKAARKQESSSDTIHLKKFSESDRYPLSERSAGSIYRVTVDTTNPFGFGLGREWFIMKRSQPWPFLVKGQNIGYILEKEPVSGFAGYKFKKEIKNTMVIGSEKIGSGEVIYITDDPYFRAFWKSGRTLLWNSVFR